MNNEPVAELLVNDGEPWGCRYSDEGTFFNADGSRMDGWIPLYTHPVKEQVETIEYTCPNCQTHVGLHVKHPVKELTDGEIDSVVHELRKKSFDPNRWLDVYTVAIETIIQLRNELAILRKAQSKPSRKCGDSYDTVCPPSICDCQGKAQEK